MDNITRGRLIQQGNLMRINNAFVEEASCVNNSVGNILISYSVPERNRPDSIQYIRLNLNRNTVILNSFGQSMCICCIQRGMWVNVITHDKKHTASVQCRFCDCTKDFSAAAAAIAASATILGDNRKDCFN